MSLSINTNIQALTSQTYFQKTNNILSKSLQRLSSGLRINMAADDASGLMIADSLKSKHTSIAQAISNANDGINIAQIADGALEESINIVTTIRTKSIQAASDGQNLSSRKAIQADIDKLIKELQMIAETTVYNGQNLLDGTFQNKVFHIGADKGETIKLNIDDARASKIGAIAYAKTNRDTESAVSDPFLKGNQVTSESLSEGDIMINGTKVGETIDHFLYYDDDSYYKVTSDSAMAKTQAINDKTNETGVQAKAVTEAIIGINGTIDTAQINGISITGSPTNSSQFVDSVNNNSSLKNMGIHAEDIGTDGLVRIIANDGRNITILGDVDMTLNGIAMKASDYTFRGNVTLSNARAMKSGDISISSGTINAGDLIINGVDIGSSGSLSIKDYDSDKTLLDSINGNQVLQQMGIRAELYSAGSQSAGAGGELDTTFGTGGKATTDINGNDSARAGILQSDGKIILVGNVHIPSGWAFAITRYNTDGSLDSSFGGTGKVTTHVGATNTDIAKDVAIQADGKIIVSGGVQGLAAGYDFGIVRLNINGTLDNTFGTGGKVTTSFGFFGDYGNSVKIQNDGKIVVAGCYLNGGGANNEFAVARYNVDGSLDNTFGIAGKVFTPIGSASDYGQDVAIQSDGKIIVAGYTDNGSNLDFAVVRYNVDGSLDNTFGAGGKVTTSIGGANDVGIALSIQSDGKILVCGNSNNGTSTDFAIVRYNNNGSLDNTFGIGGKVTTSVGTGNDSAESIQIQNDNKIVLGGYSNNGSNDMFAIVRYNSDGSLDNNFGIGGKITTDIGNGDDRGESVMLQTDDKIIIGGVSNNDFALARYTPGSLASQVQIRLVSDKQPITITGNNPHEVAGLTEGETEGTKTTGIILETTNTSDKANDDMLRRIGFDGTIYGTNEITGVNNQPGDDQAVISRSYLSSSSVTNESLSDGDININNITINSSISHTLYYGTNAYTISNTTAMSKSQAINDKINKTGVQAKAITEVTLGINGIINTATINGISIAGNPASATAFTNAINNDSNFQKMGIRAEEVGTGNLVRIISDDGRDLTIHGDTDLSLNGVAITANDYTFKGNLIFSNAQAMVNGQGQIQAGAINAGDLVVNGIALPPSGSLIVQLNDNDNALLGMINNSEELQKMGIRAEKYNSDGAGARIRLISERSSIIISGSKPETVTRLLSGITKGITKTGIKITGSQVDNNSTLDNYLRKIGLLGSQYGTTEENGVDNSGGNDILFFGNDRMNYNSGDIKINGYQLGSSKDDGISDVYANRSAKAWADAVNLIKNETNIEADIIKALQTGKGTIKEGTLKQRDFMINGIDIVRDNTGGNGMKILSGDGDHTLIDAINEYKDETGVIADIDKDGRLILQALDGRNIHVQSSSNGNKLVKFEADFGDKGINQDSVYFGNVRLVSDKKFTIKGNGSNEASRELNLMKVGLAGGGVKTEATSDLKGDGEITAGLNYKTSINHLSVLTQEDAEIAIRSTDFGLIKLDMIRSNLGSTQNQLTSTIANLSAAKINLISSESSIRDVNFAEESSIFSKTQILLQAGSFALAQSNTSTQFMMRLLQ